MTDTAMETPESTQSERPAKGTGVGPGRMLKRRWKLQTKILAALAGLVLIAGGVLLYRYFASYETTDDAQIDGYIYPISPRVAGYVTRVTVDNHQYVEAGTVVAQLDPKDYEVAVANARAALANEQATAAAQGSNVPITSVSTSSTLTTAQADLLNAQAGLAATQKQFEAAEASLRQAEAADLNAQDTVQRFKPLAASDEIPQQQYTQAVLGQRGTAAAVAAARSSRSAAEHLSTQAQ